jgi:PhnB protein
MAVNFIPTGYHTVTPALVVRGGKKAIEFYKQAFGAKELGAMYMPDGEKLMHAEIQIGDSRIMLGEESPEMGATSPQALGGSPTSLNLYVDNCDAWYDRAIKAGAKSNMAPADMFWGDRYGKVVDPFGHYWGILTHKEDVSPADMDRRAKEWMSAMAAAKK